MTAVAETLPPRVKDLTAQVFGRLTVIEFLHTEKCNGGTRAIWKCQCQCGNTIVVSRGTLRSGNTKSCGCIRKERNNHFKHGHALQSGVSVEYNSWRGMRERCYDKRHKAYKNYGGRGIIVCLRWLNSFPNFLTDMGLKPSPELTLDRIDNDGIYEPNNCKWSTRTEQTHNRRKPKRALRKWASEDIVQAMNLRQRGKTCGEIGNLFNVSPQTVSYHTKYLERAAK